MKLIVFSRLRVAIAGKNYYKVAGLMKMIVDGVPGFNVRHSHLYTVWGWKNMEKDHNLPVQKGIRKVHALICFTHQGAVCVKWKQYLTSDTWCKPVILIPPSGVPAVARWRPPVRTRSFEGRDRMHAWIDKYETKLAHSHDAYTKHKADLDTLRQTIDGGLPEYSSGPDIEQIIADLVRLGRSTPTREVASTMPHDAIVQLFPGADLPETNVDALIQIPGMRDAPVEAMPVSYVIDLTLSVAIHPKLSSSMWTKSNGKRRTNVCRIHVYCRREANVDLC